MVAKNQILLVDDQEEIVPPVKQALGSFAEVQWVETLEKAKEEITKKHYQLLLVDIGLPDGNGVNLCWYSQAKDPSVPVIFLTGHEDLSEKVMGFAAGADDYITKPFEVLELRARVEARLKKQEVLAQHASIMRWKEIEIDKDSQEVLVNENGHKEKIDLTALEFKLLTYFANHVGQVISRDKLLDEIWGKDVHVYPRSVDTHVSKLRKKIGSAASVIESIHGTGYKFKPTRL